MAANPIKGEVAFEVSGATYILVYTIDALCALEDRLNLSVEEIGRKMGGSPRIGFLRSVFHAGLREHHPALTERETGELFPLLGFDRVGALIGEAFGKAFGGPEAAAPADPQKNAA